MTKETRPLDRKTFHSYVKELYKSQPWIKEIEQSMPGEHPEGVTLFGLSGEIEGIDGTVEAVIFYGPPTEDWETGEAVTILLHVGETARLRNPMVYATDFEDRLRKQFEEMSDFLTMLVENDDYDPVAEVCFISRYEVDRTGFDYVEVIDELLGYMLAALPDARRLLTIFSRQR